MSPASRRIPCPALFVGLLVVCTLLVFVPTAFAEPGPESLPHQVARPDAAQFPRLSKLDVLGPHYPRAYFFRASEGFAARKQVSFERWEACFSRLMGIEGKVLDEEVPGRAERNIDFFTRFKRANPEQLVLLHYNGNARDPRYQTDKYFAGHWLYHNGATILGDVPAADGETEIKVDDPRLFQTDMGRYRWSNEDIGLCMLDAQGRPDWTRCEQVQLVSVDQQRGVIRVRRGCYGTEPRAFPAGKSYAAAHATEGPWGRKSNLLWYYNYATTCPRDAQGRTCAEVHAEELAARFAPGGELAAFDGLEFDVLHHHTRRMTARRGPDADADGEPDAGMIDGLNVYGIGVVDFCRRLRQRMGDDRLILADGMSHGSQRAFEILNGIESEGWPALFDWEIDDWSGGMNRHEYWRDHGARPVFNYINHKFITRGDEPGQTRRAEVPFSIHRLVLAVAMMTDSAVCYSTPPRPEPGEMFGLWDELVQGTARNPGWLGRPRTPAIRLAAAQPAVLEAENAAQFNDLLPCLAGDNVRVAVEGDALRIDAPEPPPTEAATGGTADQQVDRADEPKQLAFTLANVPCNGPDLFVQLTARAQPMRDYPATMPRLMWLGIKRPETTLVHREEPEAGICLRGGDEQPLDPETGASVRFRHKVELGDETRPAYLAHPPYRGAKGYTFWTRELTVPREGRLEFFTGMGPKSPERSDGVVFEVQVAPLAEGRPGSWTTVFEHTQVASEWIGHEVDLSRFSGRRVRLKFISDCGPKNDAITDHSYWADAVVVGPGGRDAITEPERFMSWAGPEPFRSTFTFRDVRSASVDLQCTLEGTGPVWIESIRVTHHADAIARRFENGLVLVNPAMHPYTFDLRMLSPGDRYRRLQGSSGQDPTTNNGEPVGPTVELAPRDGLFLLRN
jgi:hypothetical protein